MGSYFYANFSGSCHLGFDYVGCLQVVLRVLTAEIGIWVLIRLVNKTWVLKISRICAIFLAVYVGIQFYGYW